MNPYEPSPWNRKDMFAVKLKPYEGVSLLSGAAQNSANKVRSGGCAEKSAAAHICVSKKSCRALAQHFIKGPL